MTSRSPGSHDRFTSQSTEYQTRELQPVSDPLEPSKQFTSDGGGEKVPVDSGPITSTQKSPLAEKQIISKPEHGKSEDLTLTPQSSNESIGSQRSQEGGIKPAIHVRTLDVIPAFIMLNTHERHFITDSFKISQYDNRFIDTENYKKVSEMIERLDGVRVVNVPNTTGTSEVSEQQQSQPPSTTAVSSTTQIPSTDRSVGGAGYQLAGEQVSGTTLEEPPNTVVFANNPRVPIKVASTIYELIYPNTYWRYGATESESSQKRPTLGEKVLSNVLSPTAPLFKKMQHTLVSHTEEEATPSKPRKKRMKKSDYKKEMWKSWNIIPGLTHGQQHPARRVFHLLAYNEFSNHPTFFVERNATPDLRSLVVYSGEGALMGSIEAVGALIMRKVVLIDNRGDVVYYLKQFKVKHPLDVWVHQKLGASKKKHRVGLITRRFSTEETGEPFAGYDVFFPIEADFTERILLLATAMYMDALWSNRLY